MKPTRVRRLRIRRAVRYATLALCLTTVAGVVGVFAQGVEAGAQVTPGASPVVQAPSAAVTSALPRFGAAGGAGVWVVNRPPAGHPPVDGLRSAIGTVGRSPAKAASVVLLGKEYHVLTDAATVGQLLSAMGIVPDGNEIVTPLPRSPLHDGAVVRVLQVTYRTVTAVGTVPFATVTKVDRSLQPGQVRLIHPGAPGTRLYTYRERFVGGRMVARYQVGLKLLKAPVPALRLVGPMAGGDSRTGVATWYAIPGMTAASPWLPFGTVVTVTDLSAGRSVTVVIDDRGPNGAPPNRIIDLSNAAFAQLAPLSTGVLNVRITW